MILDKEKVNNAIMAINADAECLWDTSNTSDIQWLNGTSPISDADLQTKITELDVTYASQAYSRARVKTYPPIGDQLDALWKGGDDAAAMKVIIDKVKSDNPKG